MNNSIKDLNDSIMKLKDCSKEFLAVWKDKDIDIAKSISKDAMMFLDHIVNEILRERDDRKNQQAYDKSLFKNELNRYQGLIASPVTSEHQKAIRGNSFNYGNASLPFSGKSLEMEKLLNKIKHRRRNGANFRIGVNGEHFFIISVDEFYHQPKSIVEFSINDFCDHCLRVSRKIERFYKNRVGVGKEALT